MSATRLFAPSPLRLSSGGTTAAGCAAAAFGCALGGAATALAAGGAAAWPVFFFGLGFGAEPEVLGPFQPCTGRESGAPGGRTPSGRSRRPALASRRLGHRVMPRLRHTLLSVVRQTPSTTAASRTFR